MQCDAASITGHAVVGAGLPRDGLVTMNGRTLAMRGCETLSQPPVAYTVTGRGTWAITGTTPYPTGSKITFKAVTMHVVAATTGDAACSFDLVGVMTGYWTEDTHSGSASRGPLNVDNVTGAGCTHLHVRPGDQWRPYLDGRNGNIWSFDATNADFNPLQIHSP